MPRKILVRNLTTGAVVWMWEVDAEEAVRRGPTVWAHTVPNPPPRKFPS